MATRTERLKKKAKKTVRTIDKKRQSVAAAGRTALRKAKGAATEARETVRGAGTALRESGRTVASAGRSAGAAVKTAAKDKRVQRVAAFAAAVVATGLAVAVALGSRKRSSKKK